MIVTSERVARFVAERCEIVLCPPYTCMGIERNGEIVAGVVFNHFSQFDICVTVAGDKGAFTLPFIRAVGAYVFDQLGLLRMTINTPHEAVIDFAERLGGQVEGVKRNQFGAGRNGTVLGILKEDWKA